MLPPPTTATSLVPSDDDATDDHPRDPAAACSVQVAPESVDV